MKKAASRRLFLALALSLPAQFLAAQFLAAQNRQEGFSICYFEEGGDILYATHKTEPFGTKIVVANPVNQARITLQVAGRPDPASDALIEISPEAAEQLGLNVYYPSWVWVIPQRAAPPTQVQPKETGQQQPAYISRPRMGVFKQTGNAIVVNGIELTASHPSLPMGTRLKLTADNGRTVNVTVIYRIRAASERILEISQAAARSLGIQGASVKVRLESIE